MPLSIASDLDNRTRRRGKLELDESDSPPIFIICRCALNFLETLGEQSSQEEGDTIHERGTQSELAKDNDRAVFYSPNKSSAKPSKLEVEDECNYAGLGPDSKRPKLDFSSSCSKEAVISVDAIKSSSESRDLKASTQSAQSMLKRMVPEMELSSSSTLSSSSSSKTPPPPPPSSSSKTPPSLLPPPPPSLSSLPTLNQPFTAYTNSASSTSSGPIYRTLDSQSYQSTIPCSSSGTATATKSPSCMDSNGSNSSSVSYEGSIEVSPGKLILDSCELTHSLGVNSVQSCVNSLGLLTPADDSPGSTSHIGSDGQRTLLSDLALLSASELYSRLQKVDPDTAARQHPNNTRKVLRALQVYYETGRTLSSLLEEQHKGQDGAKSGPLRFQDPCILWVKCGQPELDRRLDARVDTMLEKGLLAELEEFYEKAQRLHSGPRDGPDDKGYVYPHGILQMLGFKEFTNYLQLSPQRRATEEGKKLFKQGVDDLKMATRRYAKQQVRWITNRFCARPGPSVPPVFSVDSTDLSSWDQAVAQAIEVVRAYTQGKEPKLKTEPTQKKVDSSVVRQVCAVCGGRIFLHQHEWTGHLKSKKHRHNVKLAREREKLSATLSARESQLKDDKASPLQTSHIDNSTFGNLEIIEVDNAGMHTQGVI
ncbi:hypothetical protein RRG08_029628 [Elysia crispata]|uniref:tRNA dimethylallyltransferase, mitochondrial n=1 Tax=Elysia crispata TaxID=231223 RepID=A0AAE0XP88_9GAST|nr:hypothetical protein RRG08_029628 [Elysia crispata]